MGSDDNKAVGEGAAADAATVTLGAAGATTGGATPGGGAPVDGAPGVRPGQTVGRFIVLNRLGAGATAVVFAAYDPMLDRRVALKFLHPGTGSAGGSSAARARLMREAQALAQLSHTNVIAIYDVGTFGDDVFIAEEFVDGQDLSAWLQERARSRREIVGVFVQAGRGLAAAHGAGLVHRDFKPANVLVGRDGRVRVVDFGLVRAAGDAAAEPALASAGDSTGDGREATIESAPLAATVPVGVGSGGGSGGSPSGAGASGPAPGGLARGGNSPRGGGASGRPPSGALAAQMTVTGALVGTPLYMAPEQFAGVTADARSDQFSFCVSLYEALYGERPFAAETWSELKRAVLAGDVRKPPAATRVPAWIRRILLRGLRPPAAERYPSLERLLDELSADPAARRRPLLVALGAVLLVGGLVWGQQAWHARRARPCQGGAQRLVGVWDGARKAAVQAAFAASGKPFAAAAWRSVEPALDEHARAWASSHRDACEATRVRGEQSEELLDLRMICLQERLDELRATTLLFARADAQVVERAVQAAQGLTPVSACADVAGLSSRVKPQRDPAARERVAALRARLAAVAALERTAKYAEALEGATEAHTAAAALGYAPATAEALALLGRIQHRSGKNQAAAKTLAQALVAADAAGDDALRARTAMTLATVLALRLARGAEAESVLLQAEAAVQRAGGGDALRGEWHLTAAKVAFGRGDARRAREEAERALELQERVFGPDSAEAAGSLGVVGLALTRESKGKEAIAVLERVLRRAEGALGPDHPDVAQVLLNLGDAHYLENDYAPARRHLERALAIRERVYGPNHPSVATMLNSLANVVFDLGEFDGAAALYRRALALRRAGLPPGHSEIGDSLYNVAGVLSFKGDYQGARAMYEEALAVYEKAYGLEATDVAVTIGELGEVQRQAGRPEAAVPLLERALRMLEKVKAPDERYAQTIRTSLAEANLDRKHHARAAALARELLATCAKRSGGRELQARLRFVLARALWPQERERGEARRLAAQAASDYARIAPRYRREAAAAERWLARHGGPASRPSR